MQLPAQASQLTTYPESGFRPAIPADKHALFQLHQEALPPDIRLVFSLSPDDFKDSELAIYQKPRLTQTANRRKVWFWMSRTAGRRVITSAVKVTAHREGYYHLEFAVHPGWTALTDSLIAYTLERLRPVEGTGYVSARAFDYQPNLSEVLRANG